MAHRALQRYQESLIEVVDWCVAGSLLGVQFVRAAAKDARWKRVCQGYGSRFAARSGVRGRLPQVVVAFGEGRYGIVRLLWWGARAARP